MELEPETFGFQAQVTNLEAVLPGIEEGVLDCVLNVLLRIFVLSCPLCTSRAWGVSHA